MSHNPRRIDPNNSFKPHVKWVTPDTNGHFPTVTKNEIHLFESIRRPNLFKAGNEGLHVIAVLDESGSMSPQTRETIDGFNTFVDKQREVDAKSWYTAIKFSGVVHTIFRNVPLQDMRPLTERDYNPIGSTNLVDACVEAIEIANSSLASKSEAKREGVMIIVFTDGEENSSRRHTKADLAALVADGKEKGWAFLFVGSDIDAFGESSVYGIDAGSTLRTSGAKTADAYAMLGSKVAATRASMVSGMSLKSMTQDTAYFTDDDRNEVI